MESLVFKKSYELRILALFILALVYVWPGQWYWLFLLYYLGWWALEVIDIMKPIRGRFFKRGPHEEADLALHRILLHGAIFLVLSVLILDRMTFDYVRDLYRVLILIISYCVIGLCQFGSNSLDEVADPPRDLPRLNKTGTD